MFADRIVADDDAPANYSIRLSHKADRYHELYWGKCLDVTSPDARRVVDALLLHIDAQFGPPPGAVDVNVLALVRGDEALLVPRLFREPLVAGRRRLVKRGWSLVDGPTVHLLPDTAEIIVTRRVGDRAGVIVDAIGSLPLARRSDTGVESGTYRLRGWYFLEPFEIPTGYSRATATRIAATALASVGSPVTDRDLARLARTFEHLEPTAVAPDWKDAMLPALLRA